MSSNAEPSPESQRPWHRLFGLSWMDRLRGTDFVVEMEKDLSIKQQFLDLVVLRKGTGVLPFRLPDGFEDPAAHNLITFKSFQESLDGWALDELVSHYVNYRKQVSPSMQDLLPTSDFRLFAVSVRFPQTLARETTLTPVREGVYETRYFTGVLRVVVVHQLPQEEHNAMLHLFSAREEQLIYGRSHYRGHSSETSTLLFKLFQGFHAEGTNMADLLEEFAKATIEEILRGLTPEERLKGLTPENVVATLTPEDRLKGLPPEDRLKGLSVNDLMALPPEMREELARMLKAAQEQE